MHKGKPHDKKKRGQVSPGWLDKGLGYYIKRGLRGSVVPVGYRTEMSKAKGLDKVTTALDLVSRFTKAAEPDSGKWI